MKYVVHLVRKHCRYEETHRVIEAPDGVDMNSLARAVYAADENDEHLCWEETGEPFVEEADCVHDVTQGPEFLRASVKVDENYKVEFTQ